MMSFLFLLFLIKYSLAFSIFFSKSTFPSLQFEISESIFLSSMAISSSLPSNCFMAPLAKFLFKHTSSNCFFMLLKVSYEFSI